MRSRIVRLAWSRLARKRGVAAAQGGGTDPKPTTDWFARVVAFLGLAVAVTSAVIDYQDRVTSRREELSIVLQPHIDGIVRIRWLPTGRNAVGLVEVPWRMVLSNSGLQQMSVVDYRILEVAEQAPRWYSGIEGGIDDASHRATQLPVKLEAGESRAFYVYVGIEIPARVCSALRSLPGGRPYKTSEIHKFLAKRGMDLYGHPASFSMHPGGGLTVAFADAALAPMYVVEVTTGRGHTFTRATSEYGFGE